MRYRFLYIFIIFILLQTAVKSAETPKVRMVAQPKEIYLGESFQLLFFYDNFEAPQQPDISYLSTEFDVRYLGAQNRNRSMISIVNGNQTRVVEKGITYAYSLTPRASGRIKIEPPPVSTGGKTLSIAPVEVEVIPPSLQDTVKIEIVSDEKEVYPLIPFTVTLNIYVKSLPGKNSTTDPILGIARHVDPPKLQISWLEDSKLEKGLVPLRNWEDWINNYRNSSGGFIINNITVSDPFDFGFSFFENNNRSLLFLPRGEQVERTDKDGKKVSYWKYTFRRAFRSEMVGEYNFDPANIKGTFAKSGNDTERIAVENVYVLSNPLTIRVKDVPEKDRPDNYIGAFGQFTWNASLVPSKVRVGEAMTLNMTLKGEGSLLQVKAPNLEAVSAITDSFKLYLPTEEISDDHVTFTWSIRPTKEGKITFPSIPVSYFDVKTENFVTLSSKPIVLDVESNQSLATETLSREIRQGLRTQTPLTRSTEGIYANREDISGANNRRITLYDWGGTASVLGGVALLCWLGTVIIRRSKPRLLREKAERNFRARQLLHEGMEQLTQTAIKETAEAAGKIKSAFLIPLNDYFNKQVDTLSETEINSFLMQLSVIHSAVTLVPKVKNLFAQLEEVRYGLDATTADSIRQEVLPLFEKWFAVVSHRGNKRKIKAMMKNERKGKSSTLTGVKTIFFFVLFSSLAMVGCSRADKEAQTNYIEALRLYRDAESLTDKLKDVESSKDAKQTEDDKTKTEDDKEKADQQKKSPESLSTDAVRSRELFLKSAAVYQGLRAKGIESGPILYNQGNAFYRAGEKAQALACWRIAQRYLPNDSYLNANLELLIPGGTEKEITFWELLMFWQNKTAYPFKFKASIFMLFVTVVLFIVLLISSLRSTLENKEKEQASRRWYTILGRCFVTVFFCFGIMTCSALYDWYRFDYQKHGITQTKNVTARKGNSEQYESVYTGPLPELSEVIILEERGNWYRVRFIDDQEGWIQKKDLLQY